MSALTAAQAARQAAVLDKPVRLDGVVTSYRALIESGAVAYTREYEYDGKRRYGLITHGEATQAMLDHPDMEPMRALTFATYWEVPKIVADWPLYCRVVSFGYDGVEVRLPDGTVSVRFEPRRWDDTTGRLA